MAGCAQGYKDMQKAGIVEWTLLHLYYANMGGVLLNVECSANGTEEKCAANVIMRIKDLYSLIDDGIFPIEGLSRNVILDKSNADSFIKAVACVQSTWLVAQCIGRAAQSLPITTLELVTVAYIVYALSNYALWWWKPLGVETPTIIRIRDRDKNGFHRAPYPKHVDEHTKHHFSDKTFCQMYPEDDNAPNYSVRIFNDHFFGVESLVSLESFAACCSIFGAIHCIGWNFSFPSDVERILWQFSCILSFIPIIMLSYSGLFASLDETLSSNNLVALRLRPSFKWAEDWIDWLLICAYVLARLYLIVEIFLYLRSVPAGCYETVQWSKFLLHIM
jgi:hypothetical protein